MPSSLGNVTGNSASLRQLFKEKTDPSIILFQVTKRQARKDFNKIVAELNPKWIFQVKSPTNFLLLPDISLQDLKTGVLQNIGFNTGASISALITKKMAVLKETGPDFNKVIVVHPRTSKQAAFVWDKETGSFISYKDFLPLPRRNNFHLL